jgi:hypothetical protein
VGVLLLKGLLERREAVLLVRLEPCGPASEPVLVADLNILDVPRLGVAQGGADSTPLGGFGVARQELELVEGVLDRPSDLGLGEEVAVQGETSPDTKNCDALAQRRLCSVGRRGLRNILGSRFISSHHSRYSMMPRPLVIW